MELDNTPTNPYDKIEKNQKWARENNIEWVTKPGRCRECGSELSKNVNHEWRGSYFHPQ